MDAVRRWKLADLLNETKGFYKVERNRGSDQIFSLDSEDILRNQLNIYIFFKISM